MRCGVAIVLEGDRLKRSLGVVQAMKLHVGSAEIAQVIDVGGIDCARPRHRIRRLVELMNPQIVLAQARIDLVSGQIHPQRLLIDLDGPSILR